MAEKDKKNEGPGCACGKGDLYEEFLKNEKKNVEASEATHAYQTKDNSKSSDSAGNRIK